MELEELTRAARDYRRMSNQIANLEADRQVLKKRIMDEMEERQTNELRLGKYRVFVTEYYAMRIDAQRLRKEQAALAEMYTLCVPSKRLTVS